MNDIRKRTQRPQRRRPPAGQSNAPRRQNGSSGNAHRNYERYLVLAREAAQRGDPIEAENCYQHAEHYFRVTRED
jgi:hypothetical protein